MHKLSVAADPDTRSMMLKENRSQTSGPGILIIARGAGIGFLGIVVGSGLRYIFQIIVARNLGAPLFGVFFLGLAVFKIFGMIGELGLTQGLIRYVALYRGEGDERRVKGVIILSLKIAITASIVIAVLLIIFSKTIAEDLFHNIELTNILRLFALALPFATLTTMLIFTTQGFKIMRYKVLVREILEPFLRIVIVIILIMVGLSLYGAAVAYLIPVIAGAIFSFYCLKKVFPQITDKSLKPSYETKKLLNFSWPLLLVQFFGVSMLWMDTIILGFFKSSQEVGIFSAAQRTALLVSIVKISFDGIFAPVISDIYNRGEIRKLSQYFQTVTKWIFTFSFPLFLLVVFFADSILSLFGPEFTQGASSLFILSLAWIIYAAVGSVGQIIVMTGRQKLHLINIVCVLSVNLILNLFLIPKYGITGAALATFAAISLMGVIELVQVYLFLKIQPYRMDFFKPLSAGALSLLILFAIFRLLGSPPGLVMIILGSLMFLIIYILVLFVFGLQEEDKLVLKKVKEKILWKQ